MVVKTVINVLLCSYIWPLLPWLTKFAVQAIIRIIYSLQQKLTFPITFAQANMKQSGKVITIKQV